MGQCESKKVMRSASTILHRKSVLRKCMVCGTLVCKVFAACYREVYFHFVIYHQPDVADLKKKSFKLVPL